jgi:hypothetical protein
VSIENRLQGALICFCTLTPWYSAVELVWLRYVQLWQVRRMRWKEGVVLALESRLTAPAIPLPSSAEEIEDLDYRRVTVIGEFDHSKEVLLGCVVLHTMSHTRSTLSFVAYDLIFIRFSSHELGVYNWAKKNLVFSFFVGFRFGPTL